MIKDTVINKDHSHRMIKEDSLPELKMVNRKDINQMIKEGQVAVQIIGLDKEDHKDHINRTAKYTLLRQADNKGPIRPILKQNLIRHPIGNKDRLKEVVNKGHTSLMPRQGFLLYRTVSKELIRPMVREDFQDQADSKGLFQLAAKEKMCKGPILQATKEDLAVSKVTKVKAAMAKRLQIKDGVQGQPQARPKEMPMGNKLLQILHLGIPRPILALLLQDL